MAVETNTGALAFIAETVIGTTPATPELQELRLTSESLAHEKNTIQSEEVRSDRMIGDLAEVGASASGAINFELSYGSYDAFLESALGGTITTINETIASLDIAGQVITGAASDFDAIPVGAWVKISGATTSGNNGIKKVTAKAADGSTLTFAAGSLSGSDTGETLDFDGKDLRNSTTRKSFSIERKLTDGTSDYFQQFLGCVVGGMSLEIATQSIITGSFNVTGFQGTTSGATIDNAGGYTATTSTPVMNGTANVGTLTKDDAVLTESFKSFSLNVNGNIRGLDKLGTTGNFDVGLGSLEVQGSFEAYFKDNSLLADFIAHTSTSFSISITDTSGNTMIISIPHIKFSTGNPAITGKNADAMLPLAFEGIRDADSNASIIISMIDA